ncbi:hypothetical protein U0070_005185 [Myodes glareolus]|uniref:Uncharacterized protein n=1 Tax=Myodes glareolus TaxID=447135 RepID=A0AAW0IG74_MYOGA
MESVCDNAGIIRACHLLTPPILWKVCLALRRRICLCPTCASANAMAWECPAQLLSPAKPDLVWQVQDAKPTAAQGGHQPGLPVCTEQIPLMKGFKNHLNAFITMAQLPCLSSQLSLNAPHPWAKQKATVDSLKGWLAQRPPALLPAHQQDVDSPGAGLDFLHALI